MLKFPFSLTLCLSALTVHGVHANVRSATSNPEQINRKDSPRPMRITARHIEGKGIGYNQGYTTLEGFFAPNNLWESNWVPFLDVRGHVFNNGKLASNAGIGFRRLTSSRLWGANAYYDYRNTNHQHYNQISAGLESLGKIWDFRVNGYLPVGDKSSSFFSRKFGGFKQHRMLISRKREFVLKGANAEIGAHVDKIKNIPFYFAAGAYYLNGQGEASWGGEARAAVDIFDYVRLEGNSSYDSLFGWIGQGQISLNIPFGRRKAITPRKENSYSQELALRRRNLQRVDRHEIIPVDQQRRKTVAINPATKEPYQFWFVKNTSSSDGTFESPFPLLSQAQSSSSPNDIIYVFEGNGTSQGMDSGILLQDSQQLLGSGNKHSLATTLGSVTIPAFTSGMPLLTNLGMNVVTLANNNTISGIHIDNGSNAGISGTSINSVMIEHNQFTANIVQTAVNLTNTSGQIAIANNSFSTNAPLNAMPPNSNGIVIDNTDVATTLSITRNTFENQGGFGVLITMRGNSAHAINIASNKLIAPIGFESDQPMGFPPAIPGVSPSGIRIIGSDTSTASASISNNTCLYHEVQGISIMTVDSARLESSITSNYVQPGTMVPITGSTASGGIVVQLFDSSVQTSLIHANTVTASKSFGIGFANIGTADGSVIISNNFVSGGGQSVGSTFFGGGIATVVENTGNVAAEVTNNVLVQNLAEGGFLGMNLTIFAPSNGALCIRLLGNTSDTGYFLYNPDTGSGSSPIDLEERYQTNMGTINSVPANSSFIPPAPIPPGSPFPFPGGPITIIPAGSCP